MVALREVEESLKSVGLGSSFGVGILRQLRYCFILVNVTFANVLWHK